MFWGDVHYKLPSTAQQDLQRNWAKAEKVGPATNVLFTLSGGHSSVWGNERVGITRSHGGLKLSQCLVGRPAIVAINPDAINVCPYLDGEDPTVQETRALYTNVVIHELTHVLTSSGSHCSSNCATCVWNAQINGNWTDGILQNSVTMPGGTLSVPWHSIDEIQAMRKQMGGY